MDSHLTPSLIKSNPIPKMSILNPHTGIRVRPLEPGDPGYGPESNAFFKAFLESRPGDTFDTAFRGELDRVAKERKEIQAEREGDGDIPGRQT